MVAVNFSPHPADIWTTEKVLQLHPSSAARQGSCKNVLAFCCHVQTICSGSQQPLNHKKGGSTSSSQQVRDAGKPSALKQKVWSYLGVTFAEEHQVQWYCTQRLWQGLMLAVPAHRMDEEGMDYQGKAAAAPACSPPDTSPCKLPSHPSSGGTGRCELIPLPFASQTEIPFDFKLLTVFN